MEWACKRWHYAGTAQRGGAVCFGVWEGGRFIGGVQFTAGSGNCTACGLPYGVPREQVAELARVALGNHEVPVSRIGSIAMRMFRGGWPHIRLVVSFADPGHSHHGGIYQAMNWIYTGETASDRKILDSSGAVVHPRRITGDRNPGIKLKSIKTPPKYRYLYALDPSLWPGLREAAVPYPKKCVASDTSDTSGVQPEKGGAILTATLQT